MTSAQLRDNPTQAVAAGTDLILDWFPNHPGSNVRSNAAEFVGEGASPAAIDFLRVAGAIFCIDKKVEREATSDAWTRDISLRAYVHDAAKWSAIGTSFETALQFLTGDRWRLTFDERESPPAQQEAAEVSGQVTLFSGGLDSLIGAIDILEGGDRVTLVGHHDSPFTDSKQGELASALSDVYGKDRVALKRLYLRPSFATEAQFMALPDSYERSSRSRSIVFIAAGILVAQSLSTTTPLTMPENGFISVNVPLTGARVGSLSTRTTHPRFISLVSDTLIGLGILNPIQNPYAFQTKGEMMAASANASLLTALASATISCSHPEQATRRKLAPMNCGCCYPCIIRRAAFGALDLDVGSEYEIDILEFERVFDASLKSPSSIRALLTALNDPLDEMGIIRNGPLPQELLQDYLDLYVRGREELRRWVARGRTDYPYAASRLVPR